MRISDHAVMLDIGKDGRSFYPSLLTGDEGHLVLVDAGLPGQFEALSAAISAEGYDISDITEIIVTHQDMDHIGGVSDVVEASNARVLAHELEAPFMDGRQIPFRLQEAESALANGTEEDRANYEMRKKSLDGFRLTVDEELHTGQILPYCGGVKVLHTPGHTSGHISLLTDDDTVLITGDAMNIMEGLLAGPNPNHTRRMKEASESLRQLLDYPIIDVIAYHGGDYTGDVRRGLQSLLPYLEEKYQ